MKKFLNIQFAFTLLVSFLAFEGLEHLLTVWFDIELDHYLALGGAGIWIVLGLKFHVICCAIPMLGSTLYCTIKKHRHCAHDHQDTHESNEK